MKNYYWKVGQSVERQTFHRFDTPPQEIDGIAQARWVVLSVILKRSPSAYK